MKKKSIMLINKIYPMALLIATLFMGIGYAAVNSISLDINGQALAKK